MVPQRSCGNLFFQACALKTVVVDRMLGTMSTHEVTVGPEPKIPGFPKDWRDQIKADLAAQLEAGGTLYGVRADGAYVARTRDGDTVLRRPERECA